MNPAFRFPMEEFPTTIAPARKQTRLSLPDPEEEEEPVYERLYRLAVIQISHTAYGQMMNYLTSRPPEAAGVLIGPKDHDAVTHFVPDDTGQASPASFTLGHVKINEHLKKYVPAGLDAKGIIHSHPFGCTSPSMGDLAYVAKCFESTNEQSLDRFLLPLVVGQQLYPYVVFRDAPFIPQFAQIVLF